MVFYTIVYWLFGPPEFVVLGCISGQPLLGLGGDPVLTKMRYCYKTKQLTKSTILRYSHRSHSPPHRQRHTLHPRPRPPDLRPPPPEPHDPPAYGVRLRQSPPQSGEQGR